MICEDLPVLYGGYKVREILSHRDIRSPNQIYLTSVFAMGTQAIWVGGRLAGRLAAPFLKEVLDQKKKRSSRLWSSSQPKIRSAF